MTQSNRSPSRRAFLSNVGLGFAGLALDVMLHQEGLGNLTTWSPPTGLPHFAPKAKNVIWLFMNGGVSQMESFDPKPMLNKYAGKSITETPFADTLDPKKLAIERLVSKDANGNPQLVLYPMQNGFHKCGQSGIEVSDYFPLIGQNVDRLAIVRSMWTTDSNHGAQVQFHSGRHMNDGQFPTLGAWVHYGLGSLNENLPQFISIGTRPYWNSRDGLYLGPAHDAVPLRIDPKNPLDFCTPERDFSPQARAVGVDLSRRLNAIKEDRAPQDRALAARIASYELAYRMQMSVPEIIDFSTETAATKKLYGLDQPHSREFGEVLLASRRFVERGVRFIQIQHGGGGAGAWDAHSNLKAGYATLGSWVDHPIAGLLEDLDTRGMLDETLVVFATEFGRSPGSQNTDGRDHHIYGFTIWMAGGGLKRGVVHGATDEIGFHAVENRHYVTDVHATILRLLGLDSRRLEVPGRKRLDIDHGKPITEIIA
jgi:hypothetical protein